LRYVNGRTCTLARHGCKRGLTSVGASAGRLDGQIEYEGSWRDPRPALEALLERRIGGKAVLHVD
jgi:hypothetical protein